ncbi:XVIPCD domain-containing protein [Stenotrophomonas koreensis]|nr:XVIPCD domain-containing protein [Stenotrophomonas koreensis]
MSNQHNEVRAHAIQEQNHLVQQLRDSGNGREADQLQAAYHAREMSGLAADVYLSAKGEGEPPAGWTRASSDPAALRAAGINLSDEELKGLLQPADSGFRAEIYLPDKSVLGEHAKPVVVYKGSTGEIIDPSAPGGRRESGGEDFLNNGQQGIGMRSDYYDRAMKLAVRLKEEASGGFEIAGHSLGGGMASAAAAVTGARATTFNASGLHPETPARFARENGLPTFNPQQVVRTYQTSDEVLNDVQNGLQRLTEQQRQGYGLLANEAGLLLREPMMQKLVGDKLGQMLPPGAQTAAAQFIEQLATTSGQEALRNVPVAVGQVHFLDPKMRDAGGRLMDRPLTPTPSQVAELAGPLSSVLHAAGQGMRVGRVVGEQVERVGTGVSHVLDKAGDGAEAVLRTQGMAIGQVVEMGSTTMSVSVKAGTTIVAQGQELLGQIESAKHRVDGRLASDGLSLLARGASLFGQDELAKELQGKAESARTSYQHKAAEATEQAQQSAQSTRAWGLQQAGAIDHSGQWVSGKLRDGYATAGAHVNRGYDLAGQQVTVITEKAPVVLAVGGGIVAAVDGAGRTHMPSGKQPMAGYNLAQTGTLAMQVGPAFTEATARHGMVETVIPSLDANLAAQEAQARKLIEQGQRIAPEVPTRASLDGVGTIRSLVGINDPAHQDYRPFFKGAQAGVYAIDAQFNHPSDLCSEQLAGALAAKAKQDGLHSIQSVVLSNDGTRCFASDTQDPTAINRQLAYVDVSLARQQPLSVSTEQVAEVNRQQAHSGVPQPPAGLDTQHEQEQQNARRMG